uniref:Histone deacetylase domain-containing protein n=1 Tax=Palpitomonas bilix TaxID=652834 RepID=A0A7S3LT68_9EUKA|mmetsp:Transcript_45385/g.117496  ORF Transcript_45385/g.117496 Transcript_45385/m.117496 type:complete len:286 (+) Transcript_45385:17-874(+)
MLMSLIVDCITSIISWTGVFTSIAFLSGCDGHSCPPMCTPGEACQDSYGIPLWLVVMIATFFLPQGVDYMWSRIVLLKTRGIMPPCRPRIAGKLPIFYRKEYNITAGGIERLHPFDSQKYGRVIHFLVSRGVLSEKDVVRPSLPSRAALVTIHGPGYLSSLKFSIQVARLLEVIPALFLPQPFLSWRALRAMQYQVGGSMEGAVAALERGWAINVGGGFHHASGRRGGGFCIYADISLAAEAAFQHWSHHMLEDAGEANLQQDNVKEFRVLIVDLDAHQVRKIFL